jgi:TonB family protein
MRSPGLAFCSLLLLTSPALQAQASLSRVDQWVAQGRYADAAADLEELAVSGRRTRDEKVLRRVIETARASLKKGGLTGENRSAARHVLCLSRAWFPEEELEGIGQALRVGGGIQPPELVGKVEPRYTETGRRARLTGIVIVEVIVDQEGCVRRPRVVKGLPMGLDKTALDAVRNWTFEPAVFQGKPVPVYYVLTINFTLQQEKEDAGVGSVKFRRKGEERPTITNRPPG